MAKPTHALTGFITIVSLLVLPAPAPSYAADDFPASRNAYTWPFSRGSIWNTPIGGNAVYVDAKIEPSPKRGLTTDEDIIILHPNAPLMKVYQTDYLWGETVRDSTERRCIKASNTPLYELPIPRTYVTEFPGLAPNNAAAILLADGETIRSTQPFQVCAGGYATTRFSGTPDHSIKTSAGIRGAHGGSGMSTLGGSLRLGELMPGFGPVRHALKVNMWAEKYLYYDTVTKGYR